MRAPSSAAAGGRPGFRTLSSPTFRMLLAGMLVSIGVLANAVYLAALDGGNPPWLHDFEAYYVGAQRLLVGESPYSAAQLAEPVDAVCVGCYLYPPFLAQAMTPLTVLPLEHAKVTWFSLSLLLAFASTWLAAGIGGAARSLERALWCMVASLLFLPVFIAGWRGNVGTLLALCTTLVAIGGVASGLGAAVATMVKVSPGALVPAAVVADRRSRVSVLVGLAIIVGVSYLLAPRAWLDYPAALLNLMTGSVDYPENLALANVASRGGLPDAAVSVVRAATVLGGAACVLVSVWLARRRGGLPAAALLGTVAMLIVPGTLWYHYLAVLLPFAAMAWPRATAGSRAALLMAAVIVTVTGTGDHAVILLAGSALMIGVSAAVLWPRPVVAERVPGWAAGADSPV